jgi:hypothetical protein
MHFASEPDGPGVIGFRWLAARLQSGVAAVRPRFAELVGASQGLDGRRVFAESPGDHFGELAAPEPPLCIDVGRAVVEVALWAAAPAQGEE